MTGRKAMLYFVVLSFVVLFFGMGHAKKSSAAGNNVYQKIAKNLNQRKTLFAVKCSKSKEVKKILKKINSDSETEFYGMLYKISMSVDNPGTTDDGEYTYGNIEDAYCDYYSGKLHFSVSYFETKKETKKVNEKIRELARKVEANGSTTVEKIQLVYQYVAKKVRFDVRKKNPYFSAYGGLVKGKTVCNGYALILYKLLEELNIPCHFLSGKAKDGKKWYLHAWNMVKLGDKWYYLDITQDDSGVRPSYTYFLKGSTFFYKSGYRRDTFLATASWNKKYPVSKANYEDI